MNGSLSEILRDDPWIYPSRYNSWDDYGATCWSHITSFPQCIVVTGLVYADYGSQLLHLLQNGRSCLVHWSMTEIMLFMRHLFEKNYFRDYFLENCCFLCGTCMSPCFCWCNIPCFFFSSASWELGLVFSSIITVPFLLVSILTIPFFPMYFLLSIHCILPTLYVSFAKGFTSMIEYDKYILQPLKWETILSLTLYAWPIPPLSAMFSPSVLIPLSC